MAVSKVLVVGGGITGSVLAIALAQRGVTVDLVEISPQWFGVGHGITIQGNALRMLRAVGVLDRVLAGAQPFDRMRLRRADADPDVTCALTLCGPDNAAGPFVTVHGSEATATFYYVIDEVHIAGPDGVSVERFGRTDLLENLLDARAGRVELLCALDDTAPYMRVLEAVRTSPDPHPIPSRFWERHGTGADERIVLPGIADAIRRACASESSFTELGLPWWSVSPFVADEEAGEDSVASALRPPDSYRGDLKGAFDDLRQWLHEGWRVVLSAEGDQAPDIDTLARLSAADAQIARLDRDGTVTLGLSADPDSPIAYYDQSAPLGPSAAGAASPQSSP